MQKALHSLYRGEYQEAYGSFCIHYNTLIQTKFYEHEYNLAT